MKPIEGRKTKCLIICFAADSKTNYTFCICFASCSKTISSFHAFHDTIPINDV